MMYYIIKSLSIILNVLVSVKSNIVNWIDSVDYNHEITLFINNHRVCIC